MPLASQIMRPRIDNVPVPGLLYELNTVIGENGMDLIGRGSEQVLEKLPSGPSVGCCNELGDGKLGCPVNTHKEIELGFSRLHFGDVYVEEAPSQQICIANRLPGNG